MLNSGMGGPILPRMFQSLRHRRPSEDLIQLGVTAFNGAGKDSILLESWFRFLLVAL